MKHRTGVSSLILGLLLGLLFNSFAYAVTLYHVTETANVSSIKKYGLLVSKGGCHEGGFSADDDEFMAQCVGKIHLAKSYEAALDLCQLKDEPLTILKVLLPKTYGLQEDPDFSKGVTVSEDIPGKYISVCKKNQD